MSEFPSPQDIPHRTPILDKDSISKFSLNKLDIQWGFLTEAIRRNIIALSDTRRAMIPFCSTEVSESLPGKACESITSIDQGVARLKERYKDHLGIFLDLAPVPDELIEPDVINAPYPSNAEDEIEFIGRAFNDKARGLEYLRKLIRSGAFLKGITKEERELIIRRYRFARDIKLLALASEIKEEGINFPDAEGEISLASGIKIGFNTRKKQEIDDLLHPELWQRRRQLKDRVYEIYVGERKYILKEKKTARHTDLKRHGHQPGNSSATDFAIAKEFEERESTDDGNIQISWEAPLGYVTFPDGYQFSVFENVKNMIPTNRIAELLTTEIINHQQQYTAEYQKISKLAKKFKNHEVVNSLSAFLPITELKKPFQLSFEEFARVKALRWQRKAVNSVSEAILKRGYVNSDFDGYGFRIHSNHNLKLEIIGLDFEYYYRESEERIKEIIDNRREFYRKWNSGSGVGFLHWNNNQWVTMAENAAYLAMLKDEGIYTEDTQLIDTSKAKI